MNSTFGPLDTLRKAWESNDKDGIQSALDNYFHALNTDYYNNEGKFSAAHDNVIRFLYGRIDSGIICDEIGCNMHQLESRAKQLGKPTAGVALTEDHVLAVMRMTERGASDKQIEDVLGFGISENSYTASSVEINNMNDAVRQFGKQGVLGI